MQVLYEDNHIIAVSKTCHEIVQGDKTGDTPLSDVVKAYIKEKYQKLSCYLMMDRFKKYDFNCFLVIFA